MPYVASGTGTVFLTGAHLAQIDYDDVVEHAGQYVGSPFGTSSATLANAANVGRIVRFVAERTMTIVSMSFAVVVAAGADDACDVGIYSSSLVRLGSAGATTGKLNALGVKTLTLTAPVPLIRGTTYYAAFSSAGATGSIQGLTYQIATASELFGATTGLYELGTMAAAHPLPDPYVRSATLAGPLLALLTA